MSTSQGEIKVTCRGAKSLPIDRIVEFQGNLKKLSKKNLDRLKVRIIEDGFNVPFFVWDHKGDYRVLDGHQRLKALLSLRKDGWSLPLLPVAFIEAKDEADARKKLLAISSQYGEFDNEELTKWLDGVGQSVAETLRLVDDEIKYSGTFDEQIPIEDDEPKPEEPKADAFTVVVYCEGLQDRDRTLKHLKDLGYTASPMDLALINKK